MGYLETIKNYLPYLKASDKRAFISKYYGNGHTGVDTVGNLWTMPVCAIFDGTIANVYFSKTLGNVVEYKSQNGKVTVLYYHLAKTTVKKGDKVNNKTIVGYEGSTGSLATGKHLHVTIKINGKMVDPLPYLKGEKQLPLETQTTTEKEMENNIMTREVIKDLNLRYKPAVIETDNVIKVLVVGERFIVGNIQKMNDGSRWGAVMVTDEDGKLITGYCNISNIWSKEV